MRAKPCGENAGALRRVGAEARLLMGMVHAGWGVGPDVEDATPIDLAGKLADVIGGFRPLKGQLIQSSASRRSLALSQERHRGFCFAWAMAAIMVLQLQRHRRTSRGGGADAYIAGQHDAQK